MPRPAPPPWSSPRWDRNGSDIARSRLQVNDLFGRDFKDIDGVTVNEFDGYSTVDLSADVDAFGGIFTAAVQNLTNEDYFTYYSQTSPLDARYFKGLGRTFRVGYRKSF